ncbi:MAG: hypothetical protein COA96_08725 [SAR86 cluster bacterium]|uniref:Uncharacterized protein n=1 Tax=SAR86 cluster bacterium TaxID=2030880 RepID=A0A2A5AZK8_9GAMM|nr:MAG: hypothetical protein COA96_08725 [SAR86 cluster bacterium]
MRESGVAFFASLTLHSLALSFVVGINFAIGLRLVGFAPKLPISPLIRFYSMHWYCVVLVFISGSSLLLAYPAKALSNPVFYLKLATLVFALNISRKFQKVLLVNHDALVVDSKIKMLAYLSLVLWVVTITAGRFLAYTHSVLLASRFY